MLRQGLEKVLQAQEPSPHAGYKKKTHHFFFNWSALVGLCYKTRPVGRPAECKGRGPLRQMPARGPMQHGALWRAVFTRGKATGPHRWCFKGQRSLGPYSLAMAKGFSTSILPQSAIVTSFRGLSRLSVLVLSTFRTTSWEGRQKSTVSQEVHPSREKDPRIWPGKAELPVG